MAKGKKDIPDWYKDKPTQRQLDAISHMRSALKWTCEIPKTKGECCKLIVEMKEEIQKRISATGYINPAHSLWKESLGLEGEDYDDGGDYGMPVGDMIAD